jgi:hypothetical protein
LDGLPSEWGEYEPYPSPYKRRTGWYWVAITKAVSGYSQTGGRAASTVDLKIQTMSRGFVLLLVYEKDSPCLLLSF